MLLRQRALSSDQTKFLEDVGDAAAAVPTSATTSPVGRFPRGWFEVEVPRRGFGSDETCSPAKSLAGSGESTWADVFAEGEKVLLLLLLYTIQGIPMGLSSSVPFLLQHRVSYKQLAVFSLVSLPFSLKVLWAPFIDSLYVRRLGRRKTWLVPIQLVCVLFMLLGGGAVDGALASADVRSLTVYFVLIYLLMASQDIAVDGWALNLLSEKLKPFGSTCNGVGQTLGFSLAHFGFLALQDPHFCNKWLRSEPAPVGVVSLGSVLRLCGWIMLASTALALCFSEKEEEDLAFEGVAASYAALGGMTRNVAVRKLTLLLLTSRIGFAAIDAGAQLMLVDAGVPKERIALLGPLLLPLNLVSTAFVGKWTCGDNSLRWWFRAWHARLFVGFLWLLLLRFAARSFVCLLVVSALHSATTDAMFSSQMAFFSRVADAAVGGTYMTFLNTLTNIGHKWPPAVALWALDGFKALSPEHGFTLQVFVTSALGCVWAYYARAVIPDLESTSLYRWKVTSRIEPQSLREAAMTKDEAAEAADAAAAAAGTALSTASST